MAQRRLARAEAREIRMRELERQQKEQGMIDQARPFYISPPLKLIQLKPNRLTHIFHFSFVIHNHFNAQNKMQTVLLICKMQPQHHLSV